jgi:hypothetical protein
MDKLNEKSTKSKMTLIQCIERREISGSNFVKINDIIEQVKKIKNDIVQNEYITDIDWCIGGKRTYEKYCHLFTELHISHINDNSIGNVTFPDLSNLNKTCKIFNYNF